MTLSDTLTDRLDTLSSTLLRPDNHATPDEYLRDETDFTVLGSGKGRIAALLPADTDVCIKFATVLDDDQFVQGACQNHVERYIRTHQQPLTPFTLPLIDSPDSHARWLAYPKINPYDDDSTLVPVLDEIEALGYRDNNDLFDPDHWTKYRGDWRLYDFGYFPPEATHLPPNAYPKYLRHEISESGHPASVPL